VPTAALEVMLGRPITHVPPAQRPRLDRGVSGPRPRRLSGPTAAPSEVRPLRPRSAPAAPESGQGSLPL
jgi:hypothetical protein